MKAHQAKDNFKQMLIQAGLDLAHLDPMQAWPVFKAFVQLPVEDVDDHVLFQCGVFTFTGEELFYLDFVRQFTFYHLDGEYSHMEQLHCEFTCKPDKELRTLNTNLWASDRTLLDEFFQRVEELREFQIAIRSGPFDCIISQEAV